MANRDLLADAIADAKAVKEVAIANAKAALEEAFTPHLKDMLAQKINEMEDMDEELDLAEVDKEKMDEEKEMDEGYGKKEMDEAEDKMDEAEDMDEELDLDEILAELELEEEEEVEEVEDLNEAEETEEVEADEEVEVEDDSEEEINLEDMSEEDLKSFIEEIIEDMIEDGELVPGPNADESEAEEEEGAEAEGEVGDADVDVDVDLQEGKEEVNESALATALGGVIGLSGVAALMTFLEDYAEKNPNTNIAKIVSKLQALGAGAGAATGMTAGKTAELEEELNEAREVINTLRSDLNEVNLLNSKLLYTNKIFRNKNLTENQKIKVLKAFDKAETVKQAKTIFETLNENLVAKTAKSNIRESLGAASKPAGVAPKRNLNEGIVQEDAMVARFKKLAGIN